MLTLDANIWVSVFDSQDRFHVQSKHFLIEISKRRLALLCPAIVVVETACAIARRTQSFTTAERAIEQMRLHPLLTLVPVDERLIAAAARIGARSMLRGADALYAAAADRHSSTLISWDRQLIDRAGAMSPTDWLDSIR